MSAKTLMVGTALAAGLLMLDVATLSGAGAQAQQFQKKTVTVRPAARPAVRAAPRVNVQRSSTVVRTNRATTVVRTNRIATPSVSHRHLNVRRATNVRINPNVRVNPAVGRRIGPGVAPAALVAPGALRIGPSGARRITLGPGVKPAHVVTLHNRTWPVHRTPHRIWWGGGWKRFVPFTALGVVLVGGVYYWPDAYVSVARPYCAGVTPDGCRLNWQMVGFEDGGGEWQCVQFCPRPGVAPPPQAVAMVAAPPAPAGRCEITIFAEPGFAGLSAPTADNQPRLAEVGWKNQIGSIQVQAGTWDFFSEDEFAGENMRLSPGPYPQLGPDWTRRIGSFMCVQGS